MRNLPSKCGSCLPFKGMELLVEAFLRGSFGFGYGELHPREAGAAGRRSRVGAALCGYGPFSMCVCVLTARTGWFPVPDIASMEGQPQCQMLEVSYTLQGNYGLPFRLSLVRNCECGCSHPCLCNAEAMTTSQSQPQIFAQPERQ